MKKLVTLCLAIIFTTLLLACNRDYKVSFVINDGDILDQYIPKNGTINNFVPNREGCEFVCWLLDDEEFDANTPITDNIILHASFKLNDLNVTYYIGDEVYLNVITNIETLLKEPKQPEKEDYIFLSWETVDGNDFEFGKVVTSDLKLYANMVLDSEYKIKLKVSFNSTGAKQDIEDIYINRLDKISDLPEVSFEGHEFLGWYINDVKIDEDTIIKETKDFTLIAKWKEIE